jgi:Tol biopolymer transport system component
VFTIPKRVFTMPFWVFTIPKRAFTMFRNRCSRWSETRITPKDNAGAWQDRDHLVPSNDVHAIPPEVVARHTLAVRETTMVGTRYSAAGSLPMKLHRFGSEYWVVRADSALDLDTTPRDLLVRVSPEGIYHCFNNSLSVFQDFRLMASMVGYAVPAESLSTGQLWAHPEWAMQALDPIWVDVDSVAGGLELVLTGFGTSVNAAVVVISLGDGPSAGWSGLDYQIEADGIFPYRLNLALRAAPFQTPNPVALVADALRIDESPTWSPAGNEIAFVRRDAATGVSGIYRKPIDGSPLTLLGTAGAESRADLDWSPRGDWIAFSRGSLGTPAEAHIWGVNRWTEDLRQITSGQGSWDSSPVFEPHGQRIAYLRNYFGEQPGILTEVPGSLRRCNVDGTGDVLLAEFNPPIEAGSLRWSPDGRFIYFARNGTLYAVPADGGTPISRPALLTGANSFNLHHGQGPLLVEQAGVVTQPQCTPAQPGGPFVRLATRDTTANDTQARFYRTGAEFYQPRWSPDGTRIAYSSNQNAGNDRDLFIGQVSYNRPPQLAPLPDQVIPAGPTFVLEVQAYDPDGETMIFDAPSRYLPPGASFDPGTHRLTWINPGPPMSEHFMVFRVMDGSEGVASRAVRIAVTAQAIADLNLDVVTSDMVWLSWTAPGASGGPSAVEYDLRYAPYAITEGNFGYSPRAWDAPAPAAPGTIQTHVIGGLSSCSPYWFAIKSKDAGGNWSPISNVPSATTMCGGGGGGGGESSARSVGPTLAGADPGRAEPAFARPGGADSTHVALVVEMAGTALAPRWSIHHLTAEEQTELEGEGFTGIVLQSQDAGAVWRERGRLALSGAGWRFGLRAMRRPARLIFLGAYDLQQTWNVVAPGAANATRALALTAARHSRLGDLTGALVATSGYDAGLGEGDTLSLDYEPTLEAIESPPPWFMVVGPAGSTGDLQGFRGRAVGRGEILPTAFALRQNRPNPFSGTTEIRFELPVEASVRLEVFDAQGRVVRTLAQGSFPVGFHSVVWDQRDAYGARVRPGVYFYRIVAGAFRAQRKMTLL